MALSLRFLAALAVCFAGATLLGKADIQKTWSCGGMNEDACAHLSSEAEKNGLRTCDHGLKEENGKCVNDKRRQGVGAPFASSWAGIALRHQLVGLNWHSPIDYVSYISAHNSYNNLADGYRGPTQVYSITELLDAGIRNLELDVWSTLLDHPRLCHGACVARDRPPHNAIKELRDWLREPENAHEIVIINIEDHLQPADDPWLTDAIREYLDVPGIGVWGTSDHIVRTRLGGQQYNVFPSQAAMLGAGKRVIFLAGARDIGPYVLKKDDFIGPDTHYLTFSLDSLNVAGNECPVRARYPQMLTDRFRGFRGDFSIVWADDFTQMFHPNQAEMAYLTTCNVNVIAMNEILRKDIFKDRSDEPSWAVWSWAANEPRVSNTTVAAVVSKTSGRWRAEPRNTMRRFLCGRWTPATQFMDVALSVSNARGHWDQGFEVCAAEFGEERTYWAPRNVPENNWATDLAAQAGEDLWINFAATALNAAPGWVVDQPPTISGTIDVTGGRFVGEPVTFEVSGVEDADLGVRPDERLAVVFTFGDETPRIALPVNGRATVSHTFSEAKTYAVTASVVDFAGVWRTRETSVTITVPDTAAPIVEATIEPEPNAKGWHRGPVTVRWTVTDDVGLATAPCADTVVTADTDADGIAVLCTAKDTAGNVTAKHVIVKKDSVAPSITASRTPPANAHGWNNTDVQVSFACSDASSGLEGPCPSPVTFGTNGTGLSWKGTVTDLAGNTASDEITGINIDKTPPILLMGASPRANANGWRRTDVTLRFVCGDHESGLPPGECPETEIIATDGAGQSRSVTITDRAGNKTTQTEDGINIDRVAPTIRARRDRMPNAASWYNAAVTVTFDCDDGLSGVGSCSDAMTVSSDGRDLSVSGEVVDKAGNRATVTEGGINIDTAAPTVSCSVNPSRLWPPSGRMVPVHATVAVDGGLSGVTGFTLVGVTSNEPAGNPSGGRALADSLGFVLDTADLDGEVLAAPPRQGINRVYTLTYQGADRAGNTAGCATTVTVGRESR